MVGGWLVGEIETLTAEVLKAPTTEMLVRCKDAFGKSWTLADETELLWNQPPRPVPGMRFTRVEQVKLAPPEPEPEPEPPGEPGGRNP